MTKEDLVEKEKNTIVSAVVAGTPLRVVENENNEWLLVCGNRLATEKVFNSSHQAVKYARTPKWDTISTVIVSIAEMVMRIEKENVKKC